MNFVEINPNSIFEVNQIPDNVINNFESSYSPKRHIDEYRRCVGNGPGCLAGQSTAVVPKLICGDIDEILLPTQVEKLPPWMD